MDYREYKDEKTQLVVLTAAQKFLQDGIESVKMTDLADSCGVGVASLYRYFGTKTAIVVAAGTLLWQDVSKLFEGVFEGPAFLEKPGLSRIRELLGIFLTLYRQEPAFLKFLYEFDEFVLREKPDQQLLMDYEHSVLDFYPVFLASFEAGLQDGSIRRRADPLLIYNSVTHAIICLAQKHLRGRILLSDSDTSGEEELSFVMDMTVAYLR